MIFIYDTKLDSVQRREKLFKFTKTDFQESETQLSIVFYISNIFLYTQLIKTLRKLHENFCKTGTVNRKKRMKRKTVTRKTRESSSPKSMKIRILV